MTLRKGRTRAILEASIDSALLAVEVYNKPRTVFRTQAYVSLMIMAWTRLMHAHLHATMGNKYYFKGANNRFVVVDGERKAWDLAECLSHYDGLSESVRANLRFFIRLRNKIEHRHVEGHEVDASVFGECQALLFNYETEVIRIFGPRFAMNESLVYSLQFSHMRTGGQQRASKSVLSRDMADIMAYVQKYRVSLRDDIFGSQEYSIRLLQIPKVSNTNRAEAAVEFVRWGDLDDDDRQAYERVAALVKDRRVRIEAANVGKLKPKQVVARVKSLLPAAGFSPNTHTALWQLFAIRPRGGAEDPFATNVEYCLYDEPHGDYVYQEDWVAFIVHVLQSGAFSVLEIRRRRKAGEVLNPDDYRP